MDRQLAEARRRKDWPAVATALQRAGILCVGSVITLKRGRKRVQYLLTKRWVQAYPFCWTCGYRMLLGRRQNKAWLRGGVFYSNLRRCRDRAKCMSNRITHGFMLNPVVVKGRTPGDAIWWDHVITLSRDVGEKGCAEALAWIAERAEDIQPPLRSK